MNFSAKLAALFSAPFREISLGYRTVTLLDPEATQAAQVGYSIDSLGLDLSGNNEGDWQGSWLVIATEDELGDPIFTDMAEADLPVYTASKGAGKWETELIAESLNNFIENLRQIRAISSGRENPVLLERNPISELEQNTLLEGIEGRNPRATLEFWQSWLTME